MVGKTFSHYLGVMRGTEGPHTQTTVSERALLSAHLAGRKRIVEIGVFEGYTTRLLADGADADAVVYAIDPFEGGGRLGIDWSMRIAKHHNRAHIASGRIKLIRTLSTTTGDQVPQTVDFVFVDGDHSLEGITADWAIWAPRLSAGGLIGLHDSVLQAGKGQKEYGSHLYYRSHIRHDRAFELVAETDSLALLRRR